MIWEVNTETVKFNVTLPSVVTAIEWSRGPSGKLILLLSNGMHIHSITFVGELKMLDIASKSIVNLALLAGEVPTVVRWSPKHPSVAAIGYQSGRLSFVDVTA